MCEGNKIKSKYIRVKESNFPIFGAPFFNALQHTPGWMIQRAPLTQQLDNPPGIKLLTHTNF